MNWNGEGVQFGEIIWSGCIPSHAEQWLIGLCGPVSNVASVLDNAL